MKQKVESAESYVLAVVGEENRILEFGWESGDGRHVLVEESSDDTTALKNEARRENDQNTEAKNKVILPVVSFVP